MQEGDKSCIVTFALTIFFSRYLRKENDEMYKFVEIFFVAIRYVLISMNHMDSYPLIIMEFHSLTDFNTVVHLLYGHPRGIAKMTA